MSKKSKTKLNKDSNKVTGTDLRVPRKLVLREWKMVVQQYKETDPEILAKEPNANRVGMTFVNGDVKKAAGAKKDDYDGVCSLLETMATDILQDYKNSRGQQMQIENKRGKAHMKTQAELIATKRSLRNIVEELRKLGLSIRTGAGGSTLTPTPQKDIRKDILGLVTKYQESHD